MAAQIFFDTSWGKITSPTWAASQNIDNFTCSKYSNYSVSPFGVS